MKDVDPQKLLAWCAIIVLAIGWIITGNNLFNRVENHEARITKIEDADAERDKAQTKRDADLQSKLNQVNESVNFANWNIGNLTKQLEKKR